MYDDITYEKILKRMLSQVPSHVDKREGSIIYDALAPAAVELQLMYIDLENWLELVFANTSSGSYLERRCAEMGIERRQASKAIRKAIFNIEVPIGSRFNHDAVSYQVIENIQDFEYQLECEMAGVIGNGYSGSLLPIDYIDGLTQAELTDIIISGEDEESDEALLNRYNLRVQKSATSGNMNHYLQWAYEVDGVGGAKVKPLWDGPGTVKIVIVDDNKQPADSKLIADVLGYIESVRPIGAAITVVSGAGRKVDVAAKISLAQGYNLQMVQDAVISALVEHFKSIAFRRSYVSYAKLGTILLGIDGIIDYQDLTLNSKTINVALEDEEIPSLGTISLEVL